MKRLVLLFDGTWSDDRKAARTTNILRLRQLIEQANRSQAAGDKVIPQRIYYDEGVGTHGLLWHLLAGATGLGLNRNIKEAYRFLANYYSALDDDRDEIYVAGFSRGAFTARSLAGFVAASGLLKKKNCNRENLAFAWKYYRTPPKKRYPSDKAKLEELCVPDVRIKFLGVFDTVGALGIPLRKLNWIAAWYNRFHDTKLGSSIDYAYHALAIDEYRSTFVPALWAQPDHNNNREVQQVWFPGVHSDVGGGFRVLGEREDPIGDITLAWMISRLRFAGLAIANPEGPLIRTPALPTSRRGLLGFRPSRPTYRLIREKDLGHLMGARYRTYKLPYPDHAFKEYLHLSALDLLARLGKHGYPAPNLEAVLDYLEAALDRDRLPVIDYDGDLLTEDVVRGLIEKIRHGGSGAHKKKKRKAEAAGKPGAAAEPSPASPVPANKSNGGATSAEMQK